MRHSHLILIGILLCLLLVGGVQAAPYGEWQMINGSAAGGWSKTNGTHNITMWNATGTASWTPISGVTNVWYLVVAGGGGGGWQQGGGGGSGGSVNGTSLSVSGSEAVTVGAGGAGGISSGTHTYGRVGGNSSFGTTVTKTAYGGGGGQSSSYGDPDTRKGASSGGSYAGQPSAAANTYSPMQGRAGGAGGSASGAYPCGGGGGYSEAGVSGSGTLTAGRGGAGFTETISGLSLQLSGGGGGSGYSGGGALVPGTASHGGGAGGLGRSGYNATANTGGGGGGGDHTFNGGSGGSGIVIIQYQLPPPVASFTATNVSAATNSTTIGWAGVAPFTMVFNDTSTNTPTTWNWSYQGYGTNTSTAIFSTVRNPVASFTTGNFTVALNATNAYGANISTQVTWVNVTQPVPVASFTTNTTGGCAPLPVQFNDTSTNSPTSWLWSAKNVTGNDTWFSFSTVRNATSVFGVGNWSMNLSATNTGGTGYSTQITFVNVSQNFVVFSSFTTNRTTGAAPLSVQFNDTSYYDTYGSLNPTMWNWSVNNTPISNFTTHTDDRNISYTFTTQGLYQVNLTTYNATSTPTTALSSVWITANESVSAIFVGTPTTGAAPLLVSFVDMSTGLDPYDWNWTFGDGYVSSLRNPSHIYTTQGSFTVNLTMMCADGADSEVKVAYITTSPAANFTANNTESARYGMPVQFYDNSSDGYTTFAWTFGDGGTSTSQNPVYIYDVARKYNVTLTASGVLADNTSTKNFFINLSSDSDLYLKSRIHFTGISGSTSFLDSMGVAWMSTDATISTAQSRFNGTSGLFSAAKSKISTLSNPTFDFGTGDFTIEQWVFPTASANHDFIVSRTTNPENNGWGLYSTGSNNYRFYGGSTANATPAFIIPLNGWSHVAVVRQSGLVSVYVNGTLSASATLAGNYDVVGPIVYGDAGLGLIDSLPMYLDETSISSVARWSTAFTAPVYEYAGDLYPIYPDINPLSTLRFKTDPSIPSNAFIANGTPRYRTLQIQNVNNATNITTSVGFNPLYQQAVQVLPNTSTWADVQITYSNIDNVAGRVLINATRPGGFAPGATRASFVDVVINYYNYSCPCNPTEAQYYGVGTLTNGTTGWTYPVHNFIVTNISFVDWDTKPFFTSNATSGYANFSAFKMTDYSTGFPNVYNWSWGDGTWTNGTDSAPTHVYDAVGVFDVSLQGRLWQNMSVVNTSTRVGYITILNPILAPSFDQSATEVTIFGALTTSPLVYFNSTTLNASWWNWSFGDGTYISGTDKVNVSHSWLLSSGAGVKNVTMTAALAINTSVSNMTWRNTTVGLLDAKFHAVPTTGIAGVFVTFTDDSIVTNINNVTYNWSFGDGTYSDSTAATLSHIYTGIGIYTVSLIVANDAGVDSETKYDYIIVSTNTQQSTWYSPLQVDFQIVNSYGVPLPGLQVNATFVVSTFPDKAWLTTMFGIPSTVADQMTINYLTMTGNTTGDGGVVFTMHSSLQYNVTVRGGGYDYSIIIQPADNKYTIWMAAPTVNNSISQVNATLTFSQPTPSNATFGVRYQDTSGYTTLLEFYLKSKNNDTVVYSTSVAPGTGLVWLNVTIPNVRGEQWRWYYNAVRNV